MKTKHFFVTAMLAVVALFFVACTSDDDVAAEGELEQGVVKAEFTISFPQQMGGFTRQGIKVVQGQTPPVFRGLQNIELRPFNVVASGVNENTELSTLIALGSSTTSTLGYTLANDALYAASKSHLYRDISVPIGTRSFIFYGKAMDQAASATGSANAVNGVLEKEESTTDNTLNGITFSPKAIYTGTGTHQEAEEIAQYLTNIAKASVGSETTLTLFPNLKDVRTGSWNSVKAVAQQIYESIYQQVSTGNLQEAIVNAILKQTWGTTEYVFAQEQLDNNNKTGKLVFTKDDTYTQINKTFTFPQNQNLPDGAVYILWDGSKFNPVTSDDTHGLDIATLNTYVYPPSLYYYGLSDIKTVTKSMSTSYNDTKTWADILAAYDGVAAEERSTVVQSTTRSIAIVKEVQYGVGRLDVGVTGNGTNGTELKDNAENYINFDSDDFPVTGILVANQRPVDYQFATKSAGTQYTIYDSQVYNVAETANSYLYPAASATNKTHTLVLQTPDATSDDDAQANVRIAIEFLNNSGKSFVGKDNEIIYPNTKFYLIGTLQPYKNVTNANGAVYKGTSTKIAKAFVQYYITTANFKVKTLQNAYNLLPDLRSPQLEIGLSVDLTWETGITQEITIE